MKVFITGVTGYIGGSLAARLVESGMTVSGLVRDEARAAELARRGVVPVVGDLADTTRVAHAALAADATINAANSDDRGVVDAMLSALRGTGKTFVQSSGTSIVADLADGEHEGPVYDETTPVQPLPLRAGRVQLNDAVLAASSDGVRSLVICPSLIYGRGRGMNPHSIQVPWMIAEARKHRVGRHIGPGLNVWSNVHIDDLVDLYVAALAKAPAGAFYFAENGESSMRDLAAAVSRMLGFEGRTEPMTVAEAVEIWGEGGARYTMGSNSRVRAKRAREELGWSPTGPSLQQEVEEGEYRV
ncbi:MAG: NAD-dependent epimerase/dehydratase family protein [Betaproteobacteria bacterium]|nr:NAD-dependent epimerase/dehydratase family protein [Betaproteobacteria bacterium]